MDQEAKSSSRLLPSPQQHQNQNAVRHIEDEQAVGGPGVPENLRRVHPDGYQRRHCQKHAGSRQPSLDPAGFPGVDRDSHSPGMPVALNAKIQLSESPREWRLRCTLLNKSKLRASETIGPRPDPVTFPTRLLQ